MLQFILKFLFFVNYFYSLTLKIIEGEYMNIQITPNFLSKRCNNDLSKRCNNDFNSTVRGLNYCSNSNVSYPNLKPLAKDTVSFGANIKKMQHWNQIVPIEECTRISDSLTPVCTDFLNFLKRSFKDLLVGAKCPDNPIALNGIKARVKKPLSIAQKAIANDLHTNEKILELTDLVGARIVLRNASKDSFGKIFERFTQLLEQGKIKVIEIENYRPDEAMSYVAQRTLNKFENACKRAGQYPKIIQASIPNNYTAVHLTVEYKGQPIEIQLIGSDVEFFKEIEDIFYKRRCNKDLAPKYKSIQYLIDKLMENLTLEQHELLDNYIMQSYINARNIPVRAHTVKPSVNDLMQFPSALPRKLSFENIYRMMEICNAKPQ